MSLKNKGTANYIYELRRLIDLGFNVAELKTLPFHLLPVAVGLMFVGFVIFFIGVATGLIAGVRAPRITRALRRR